ncbi:cysteine hydrolase family protein [Streptosporangium saharense]|uniref:Nicotinamidase-related amidase n=1 Tax=Streptosporangium saharense TaxID=1706840 RepID=A0A7W7QU09_9ACTN|nr:isochorismatase family cysteine hydrolase [Streptosporangium saharense]MBB4919764.1 nicotinamidase-related amidase [Streptosporangium saharense]
MSDPHLTPNWSTSALLTIDVQRDFLSEAPYGVPGTTEVLPALARLTAAFRTARRPIVRLYRRDGQDADLVRRTLLAGGAAIVAPGSAGSAVAADLLPPGAPPLDPDLLLAGRPQPLGEHEVALFKPRWGAFYRTELDELLRGWGVDTVVVAGCNFPNCPRATLVEASERDYRVVLAEDAVSGLHDIGRAEVTGIGVGLRSVQDITASLTFQEVS